MPWQWTGNRQSGSSANYSNNNNGGNRGGKEPSGRHVDCPSDLCRKHHGGKAVKIPPHRHCCQVCFTPKSAAPAITQTKVEELRKAAAKEAADKKTAAANAPSPPSAPLSKRALRRKNAAERKAASAPPVAAAANTPPTPKAPAAVAGASAAPLDASAEAKEQAKEPTDTGLPWELPIALAERVNKISGSVGQILEKLGLDKFPTELDQEEFDKEFAAKTAAAQPSDSGDAKEAATKTVALLKEQVAAAIACGYPATRVKSLEQWLADEEAALLKLGSKKEQPASLQVAALVRQKAAAQETLAVLQNSANDGQQRASLRSSTRVQLLDATAATCVELKAALIEHDRDFAAAHEARKTAFDAKATALLADFDARIAEAGPAPDAAMGEDLTAQDATKVDAELVRVEAQLSQLELDRQAETVALRDQLKILQDQQTAAAIQATTLATANDR